MKRMLLLIVSLVLMNYCFCNSYSNAVTAGDFLYISGQFPIDPVTGQIMQGDIKMLTDVTLDHVQHWLHEKGFTMNQVIKTQIYLKDIRDLNAMDAAYSSRFNFQFPPARDVVEIPNMPDNASIQISCIAYKFRN
jgi:2-iminobutanoate/2-iminopropanoate deaminase